MTKAQRKRAAIADRLADFVLAQGLPGASLRPLAAAAGISDRMLLYYFEDKPAIIAAVLGVVTARLAAELGALAEHAPPSAAALEHELATRVTSAALWPYMCVWLEVAALAARGDPLFVAVGSRIAGGFRDWIATVLGKGDPAGHASAAERILLAVEGRAVLHAVGLRLN